MKRTLAVGLLVISCLSLTENLHGVQWSAKWIWQEEDGPPNSWVAFRKTFDLSRVPDTAIAAIGVDSKYWLWINGRMAQFEGGSARGPSPGSTWYDEIDVQPYLRTGENTIAILVWYWGRETNKGTHLDSGRGGLVFQADLGHMTVRSDTMWKVKQHPAYDPESGGGNQRLVPYSIHFDGQKGLGDWTAEAWYEPRYDDRGWTEAVDKGTPPCAPWGELVKNVVPALVDHGLTDYDSLQIEGNTIRLPYTNVSDGTVTIEARLPFNRQVTPYLEIASPAGKTITIDTDNRLNAIIAKYTTRSGPQRFETYSWMSGHVVTYEIPAGVEVRALKYRWTGVGRIVGDFSASDPFYQRLWWMGRNTLYICARDNFMDCPDRERALWIGDVADQASYLFYVMDDAGRQLLKKAILATMAHRRDKVFGALAPGRVRELPSQSLQFISMGIWPYYFHTGDIDTLREAYPCVHDYLALWPMGADGLPQYRRGASPDSWDWSDWGVKDTIDKEPMQFALYYMALKHAQAMAEALGESAHRRWYDDRIKAIHTGFTRTYWNGSFYSSDAETFKDDRANAIALLAGLADSDKFDSIAESVLIPVRNSSPHIEWMVEEALCLAGHHDAALARMKERYREQVERPGNTTLYETFPAGGSCNHAWNAPNAILTKHIVGVAPTRPAWSAYAILPNLVHFTSLRQVVPCVKGKIVIAIQRHETQYRMELTSPGETVATVGIPKEIGAISLVKANGKPVWKHGAYVGGVDGIIRDAEDDRYIKFRVDPGQWYFEASE